MGKKRAARTLLLCELGQALEVGHVAARVADGLNVDGLRVLVDGRGEVLHLLLAVGGSDKLHLDSHARECHLELVVRPAVKERRGHEVVARLAGGGHGDQLSGLAGGSGQGTDAALEGSHTVFEDVVGRITRLYLSPHLTTARVAPVSAIQGYVVYAPDSGSF